jgi:hypothetical protein
MSTCGYLLGEGGGVAGRERPWLRSVPAPPHFHSPPPCHTKSPRDTPTPPIPQARLPPLPKRLPAPLRIPNGAPTLGAAPGAASAPPPSSVAAAEPCGNSHRPPAALEAGREPGVPRPDALLPGLYRGGDLSSGSARGASGISSQEREGGRVAREGGRESESLVSSLTGGIGTSPLESPPQRDAAWLDPPAPLPPPPLPRPPPRPPWSDAPLPRPRSPGGGDRTP